MSREKDVLTTNLRVEELELGVFTPRLQFDPKYIGELADDIERNGQQKPIICRLHPEKSNVYQVVDGEHRVRAVKKLGHSLIRAEVKVLSDEEALYLAMRINEMHGKRLDKMEQGLRMLKLNSPPYNWTQEKIGKLFGRSREWVSDRIAVVSRSDESVLKSIGNRLPTLTHAIRVIELPPEEQKEVVDVVAEHKLSTMTTKALVDALKIAETPEEKKLVKEKIPKLKAKKAKMMVDLLKTKNAQERTEVLERPIEAYGEIITKAEEFARIVEQAPEAPVLERVICPDCGREGWIDWIGRKVKWTSE
jgi:ParB family chromosome partitioning protein